MGSPIVSDASCLIGLSNIGSLELLRQMVPRLLIPPAVEKEFGSTVAFAERLAPSDRELVKSLGLFLGAGESEAIALALEHQALIILDDKRARVAAEGMGLQPIGTVGILLRAHRERLIPSLAPVLDELEAKGFYISSAVKKRALTLASER